MPQPTLDYGRSAPLHSNLRRAVISLIAALLAIAVVWAVRTVWPAYKRYQHELDYLRGSAALTNYQRPPGTILFSPTIASPSQMWTETTDPFLSKNLMLIGRLDAGHAYLFAQERQTFAGTAFVASKMDLWTLPQQNLTLEVEAHQMIWGRFPWYGHRLAYRHLAYLTFEPGAGKSLPTLCAGQPDALASVWTLPVLIDGRQEQVRFDLASDPPTITASFGVVKSFGPHQHIVY